MCYELFLGSDVPLPTSEWRKEAPGFYLTDSDRGIRKAERHFSKSHVYYAGSHEGCGCGFFFDPEVDPDGYEDDRNAVKELVAMINQALRTSASVELLVTWAGHEKRPPTRRLEMKPEDLLAEAFPLEEGDFVTFRAEEDVVRG